MLYFYGRYIRSEISFFRLLFIAAIFQTGWGILQWFGHLPSYHPVFPVTGSFHNPALWGIFSTLGLLAGTALFKRQQKNGIRILWGAGMFFLLLCIGLSASRASWIALAAGICWIGSTSGRGKSLLKRQSVFSAAGFLVIGAIVCYGLYMRLFCLYKDNNLEEKATKQAGYILDMPVKVVNTSVLRYRHQAKLFLSNKQSTE